MGFKKEFLLQNPPADCVCPVCHGVLVDPRQLSPCRHVVCVACLPFNQPQCKISSCSVCGIQLWRRPTKLPASFTERILSLKSRCHLECGFQGSLKVLPQHLASDCPNSTVSCPNRKRGCNHEFLRRTLDAHLTTCRFRMTSCEGCGKRLLFNKLQAHQARQQCVAARLMNETIRSEMRNSRDVREHWLSIRKEQVALQSQITRLRSSRLEARRQSLSAMNHEQKRERTAFSARFSKSDPTPRQKRSMSAPTCSPASDDKQENHLPVSRNLPNSLQPMNVHLNIFSSNDDNLTDISDDMSLIVPSEYSSGSFGGSFNVRKSVDGMMTSQSFGRLLDTLDVEMKCRQCGETFKQKNNHGSACCWHRGLTCSMCGRLSFKRGCVIGCHKPEVPD